MPVWKFRDISEMQTPPSARSADDNLRIACELSELTLKLHPRRAPRGVRKYRSIDEAQADVAKDR